MPLLVGRSPVVLLQGPGLLGVWLAVSLVCGGGVVALGDFVGGACPAVALCGWSSAARGVSLGLLVGVRHGSVAGSYGGA